MTRKKVIEPNECAMVLDDDEIQQTQTINNK